MRAEVAVALCAAGLAAAATQPLSRRRPRGAERRLATVLLFAGLVGAVGLLRPASGHAALVVIGGADLAVVAWLIRRVRRRRESARRSRDVLEVCDALAAELRAGLPVVSALQRVTTDWPPLRPVAEAAQLGADVPAAFRALSREPGLGRLATVAAAWQVSERSGSGLSVTLRRTADLLRSDLRMTALVEVELGAARATARLLAALPLFVLLLGSGIGVDPIGFFASPWGLVALAAGSALLLPGVIWLEQLARLEPA